MVFVLSDTFLSLATAQARSAGMPDLEYLIVPYPVSGLSEEAVRAKADAAGEHISRLILAK